MGYPHELKTTVGFELGTLSFEFRVERAGRDMGVFLGWDRNSQIKNALFDIIYFVK